MHSLLAEARRRWLPFAARGAAVFAFRCARPADFAVRVAGNFELVFGGGRFRLHFVFGGFFAFGDRRDSRAVVFERGLDFFELGGGHFGVAAVVVGGSRLGSRLHRACL